MHQILIMLHFKFHTWGTRVSDQLVKIKEKSFSFPVQDYRCAYIQVQIPRMCAYLPHCSAVQAPHIHPLMTKNINVYTHI